MYDLWNNAGLYELDQVDGIFGWNIKTHNNYAIMQASKKHNDYVARPMGNVQLSTLQHGRHDHH